MPAKNNHRVRAFTLIEMLVVITIIALLITLVTSGISSILNEAKITASTSNLHQLANASLAYMVDHEGAFAPSISPSNLVRWHGSRPSISAPFELRGGYLAPYMGDAKKINTCPLLSDATADTGSFEAGAGGYGYNGAYLGGQYINGSHMPMTMMRIPHPGKVIHFTLTAFAKSDGIQEYPFTEPYISATGGWSLQPSTHFRAKGKTLVAWVDGRVSRETSNQTTGPNYYGGDNQEESLGWFGPTDDNGYWNPNNTP
ncbi:type II secretion system protein [Kiritimatiellaeota bacterium B1221]|nr:type II secretion system protein [Kiritimatiellaeota bacterium B1221]